MQAMETANVETFLSAAGKVLKHDTKYHHLPVGLGHEDAKTSEA